MPDEQFWWHQRHQEIHRAYIPGTDEVVTGGSTEQTLAEWKKQCQERNIELPNFVRTFQDCACRAIPIALRARNCAFIDDEAPAAVRQPRLIGLGDIMGFFSKVKEWWNSSESVTQEEANRRAAICRMCPLNVDAYLPGCKSCSGVLSDIATGLFGVLGNKHTESDHELKHCGVCACSTRVIAWVPLEVLRRHREPGHEFPAHCWQKE